MRKAHTKIIPEREQYKLSLDAPPGAVFIADDVMQDLGVRMETLMTDAGVIILNQLMEAEVRARAGERYAQGTPVDRWGTQKGFVIVGTHKRHVEYPRVRSKDGKEVQLDSYQRFHEKGALPESAFRMMMAGVSSRDYKGVVTKTADAYGLDRSSISRHVVEATAKQLDELCNRDLSNIVLDVIFADGVHIAGAVLIALLGVDRSGEKHVLGFREGETENAEVCMELFADVERRGLRVNHPILAVLDGGKGLAAAVRRYFGKYALIQRCTEHKTRNVLAQLPQRYHAEIRRKLRVAYAMNSEQDARRELKKIVLYLRPINDYAADSLEEGMEETLTLHKLGVPMELRRSLRTTNCIESLFSRSRHIMRNVKRWRSSKQIHRWAATTFLHAEKNFRKVQGYKHMPKLADALEQHMNKQSTIAA